MGSGRWPILASIGSYADFKGLPARDLGALAAECRDYIIDLARRKQIHLGSNLGAVELSIALARAFDLDRDAVFYDTGHQAYVHKMITGRFARMETIRDTDGLAGLQDPAESPYDKYAGGHAGNALSVAAGFLARTAADRAEAAKQWRAAIAAAARLEPSRRRRKKLLALRRRAPEGGRVVVPVIGDAALGSGMAMEALGDISFRGEKPIVVVNDNGMSISRSVGSFAKAVSGVKMSRFLGLVERALYALLWRTRAGRRLYRLIYRVFHGIGRHMAGANLFSALGYMYIGPVDGHDIKRLTAACERAKWYRRFQPVVLHVRTVKGKGLPDERDGSGKNHASGGGGPRSVGAHLAEHLLAAAQGDAKIRVINPAMTYNSGFSGFAATLPEAYLDVGICEEHAIALGAAMGLAGLKPYVVEYSSFLQRAYDQLLHDASRTKAPLNVLIDRAEVSGGDGDSHHGIFDVGFLKTFPGTVVYAPSSVPAAKLMLDATLENAGEIIAVRYPKTLPFPELSAAELRTLRAKIAARRWRTIPGTAARSDARLAVVAYGAWVQVFCDLIAARGAPVDVVDALCVVGYDRRELTDAAGKYRRILVFEEIYGDLGLAGDFLRLNRPGLKIIAKNLPGYPGRGASDDVRARAGLDPAKALAELLGARG